MDLEDLNPSGIEQLPSMSHCQEASRLCLGIETGVLFDWTRIIQIPF